VCHDPEVDQRFLRPPRKRRHGRDAARESSVQAPGP
jgi:hypothetical protein